MRIYHEDGTLPIDDSIFVFGSNLQGRHGKGAAKVAVDQFGAVNGFFQGPKGNSFAIPTKVTPYISLTLDRIKKNIENFMIFTYTNPSKSFFITRVGCGLAGHKDEDIAPLFYDCNSNCSFPINWKPYLEKYDVIS
ncbi:MAG: A1S_2505 family phage non-structural protein [Waterburya sp.]